MFRKTNSAASFKFRKPTQVCAAALLGISVLCGATTTPSLAEGSLQLAQNNKNSTKSLRLSKSQMKRHAIPPRLKRNAMKILTQNGKQTAGFDDWDFVDAICDDWVAICETPECNHGIVDCDGQEIPF